MIDPKILAEAWREFDRDTGGDFAEMPAYDRATCLPPGWVLADGQALPLWVHYTEVVWRSGDTQEQTGVAWQRIFAVPYDRESRRATYDGDDVVMHLFRDGYITAGAAGLDRLCRVTLPKHVVEMQEGSHLSGCRSPRETAELRSPASGRPFTCDGCGANAVCPFAFDLYNTDGDCLAEK